uniref:Uncharacterized protein n=1 Tax=Terrapene triunguis TaxID=2587831 RepID=A0A674IWD0_9SAUR
MNTPYDSTTIGKVAAHVPDLIVYGDFSQEVPFIENFDGVLLFADISGGFDVVVIVCVAVEMCCHIISFLRCEGFMPRYFAFL